MFLFRNFYTNVALLLFCLYSATNAVELRSLVQFEFPAQIGIDKKMNDVKEEREWDTDHVLMGGLEFIFAAEFSPIHYGFGFGFKTSQKQNSLEATPMAIPIWANVAFGSFNKDRMFSPYIVTRYGTLLPLTTNSHWWERPFHYFVEIGAGVIMPWDIGLEVKYDYTSMRKSFSDNHTNFRISSGRLAIQLSLGFELSRDRTYKPNTKIDDNDQ